MAKPMTGFITSMMPFNCSSVIILAKTVENDMPINIKLSTGVGSRLLMIKPIPAEASSMASMTVSVEVGFLVRRSILPVI